MSLLQRAEELGLTPRSKPRRRRVKLTEEQDQVSALVLLCNARQVGST
jgi:hypothetical protein